MILTWNDALNIESFDPYKKQDNANNVAYHLLNKAFSMLEYENLPDTISQRNLKLLLQIRGYCCIPDPSLLEGKLYALWGTLGGKPDPYYMPTECIIANPALGFNRSLAIGKECVIVPHDALYMGLMPLLNKYARLLCENELTMYRALINVRSMALISAPDDATCESAIEYLSDLENGKLGVVSENSFFDGIKSSPTLQTNQTIIQLIEMEQYLKASVHNELGMDANFNMKRETLNSAETELNQDALLPFIDNILYTQQQAFDEVNAKFGYNIKVKLSSSWAKRRELLDSSQMERNRVSSQMETRRN